MHMLIIEAPNKLSKFIGKIIPIDASFRNSIGILYYHNFEHGITIYSDSVQVVKNEVNNVVNLR